MLGVALKYCGGCNPDYDRVAVAESIHTVLDIRLRVVKRVHINKIFDAILKGKTGGYPADIRLMGSMCNNYLNQTGNSNKAARALQQLEFFCVNELFMTAQARYADLLLPVTSAAERSDLTRPWPSGPYFTFMNRALEPLGECKSDLQIVSELAERLGIADFNPHTEDEWLKLLVEHNPEYRQHIKDYEDFKREGIHRVKLDQPIVAFSEQIADIEKAGPGSGFPLMKNDRMRLWPLKSSLKSWSAVAPGH